jgi:hypothetical protein
MDAAAILVDVLRPDSRYPASPAGTAAGALHLLACAMV